MTTKLSFSLLAVSCLAMAPCPTFSPDGSQIAFAWNGDLMSESNGFDLYVKVIGSENLLRLTHHPSEWISPAWSPDGMQIAFHRISGKDTGLYVVPALGGPERKLRSTRVPFGMSAPINWSPDGKWIAYVESPPPADSPRVRILSVEKLESKPIPYAGDCLAEGMPAFSHSGTQLAYLCLRSLQDLKPAYIPSRSQAISESWLPLLPTGVGLRASSGQPTIRG